MITIQDSPFTKKSKLKTLTYWEAAFYDEAIASYTHGGTWITAQYAALSDLQTLCAKGFLESKTVINEQFFRPVFPLKDYKNG